MLEIIFIATLPPTIAIVAGLITVTYASNSPYWSFAYLGIWTALQVLMVCMAVFVFFWLFAKLWAMLRGWLGPKVNRYFFSILFVED